MRSPELGDLECLGKTKMRRAADLGCPRVLLSNFSKQIYQ
jgi:hypothetical protein